MEIDVALEWVSKPVGKIGHQAVRETLVGARPRLDGAEMRTGMVVFRQVKREDGAWACRPTSTH